MDVTFAADGRCIAKTRRHLLDRRADVPLRHGGAVEGLVLTQRQRCQNGAGPCAEIFCGDIRIGEFPQIRIDVGRVDPLAFAGFVDVLEELLPGKFLAGTQHLCYPAVPD
jgi:hypothetical protein